jgi:hypothetical protein
MTGPKEAKKYDQKELKRAIMKHLMILPDWVTNFAAARDMRCPNCRNDNALIIRGRFDSQGYSN